MKGGQNTRRKTANMRSKKRATKKAAHSQSQSDKEETGGTISQNASPETPMPMARAVLKKLSKEQGFTYYNPRYWKIVAQPKPAYFGKGIFRGTDNCQAIEIPWSDPTTAVRADHPLPSFAGLPKELQLIIWKMALPEPRVVQLNAIEYKDRTRGFDLVSREKIDYRNFMTCMSQWVIFKDNYHLLTLQPTIPANSPLSLGFIDARRDTFATCIDGIRRVQADGYNHKLIATRFENLALGNIHKLITYTQLSVWEFAKVFCPRLRSFTILLGDVEGLRYGYEYCSMEETRDLRIVKPESSLLKVDWNPIYPVSSHLPRKIRRNLETSFAEANIIRKNFKRIKKSSSSRREFHLGLLAHKVKACPEKTWLIPVNRQPYNVKYYTRKPSDWDSYMYFEDLEAFAWCSEDGTLFSRSQGHSKEF